MFPKTFPTPKLVFSVSLWAVLVAASGCADTNFRDPVAVTSQSTEKSENVELSLDPNQTYMLAIVVPRTSRFFNAATSAAPSQLPRFQTHVYRRLV